MTERSSHALMPGVPRNDFTCDALMYLMFASVP
jgi:hypothetical protein